MPSKYTSPFAPSFKSAVKRGMSYNVAVYNIAKRWKKTPEYVWESLWKADCCYRQKFNGQWIYWPHEHGKYTSKTWKTSQWYMWQWYTEWCMAHGYCTPEQMYNHHGSQKDFMTWCRKFFGKQYNWSMPKRMATKPKARTRKPKRTRRTTTKAYKFPTTKSRTTRKYRRAA